MYINIIGLVAATLTTVAFIPQAVKTFKTKSTEDLSPAMFTFLCLGIILWLVYGILTKDIPIILANGVTICFASVILYYIFAPNNSIKLEHIGIWTQDLEGMKNFYTKNFNAEASKLYSNKKSGFSSYFISLSAGSRIELMHNNKKTIPTDKSNQGHISISVGSKEQVNIITNFFRQQGIEITGEPRTTGDGYYESVIQDPEGNLIEITI